MGFNGYMALIGSIVLLIGIDLMIWDLISRKREYLDRLEKLEREEREKDQRERAANSELYRQMTQHKGR